MLLLTIKKNIANESIELGNNNLHPKVAQKPPGTITDKDLNFQSHRQSIIKTTNQKLSALIRVAEVFD